MPEGVKVLQGVKKAIRHTMIFVLPIRRIYEDITSNEWWIADNHTFDGVVVDKNGKQHRHIDRFHGCPALGI